MNDVLSTRSNSVHFFKKVYHLVSLPSVFLYGFFTYCDYGLALFIPPQSHLTPLPHENFSTREFPPPLSHHFYSTTHTHTQPHKCTHTHIHTTTHINTHIQSHTDTQTEMHRKFDLSSGHEMSLVMIMGLYFKEI